MSRLLSVTGLKTVFPDGTKEFVAVKEISFHLDRGETVGIVGESGSGKSVTSLSVMRLLTTPGKVASGNILFHPKQGEAIDLLSLPEQSMRLYRGKEIAMIFQEPMTSLNPVLTCGYQVAEALRLHLQLDKKVARAKTEELFELV
ncbi:MAG: ATP-binding cassette domain-containing protein, partial [Bacteroidota bacterium]